MMQFTVDAPYARRETRPSLRTGSAERRNWKWKKKSDVSFSEASEKNSDSTGCVTAWKFEEGEPIMELMEDIVNVLERLEMRDKGKRREGGNGILIHHLATQIQRFVPPTPIPSPDLLLSSFPSYGAPPPSYDDTLADLPPDYTTTDALATLQTPDYTLFPSLNLSITSDAPNCMRIQCNTSPSSLAVFNEKSLYGQIDFADCPPSPNPPTYWAGDNDKKKEEEAGGAGSGDGDGGGGDNGGGNDGVGGTGGGDDGNGGGGGGDGDWDNWATGKKKKKGKKAQEEEERKKKEEEEEAERKKKEEEEMDWGIFTTAKKRGKKGKAADPTSEPLPEPVAPAAPAAPAEDDEWFATTVHKGKKGKKGKNADPELEPVKELGPAFVPMFELGPAFIPMSELEPAVNAPKDSEPVDDWGWGWRTTTKGKKGKNTDLEPEPSKKEPAPEPEPEPEPELPKVEGPEKPADDREEPAKVEKLPPTPPGPVVEERPTGGGWSGWGAASLKKKRSKENLVLDSATLQSLDEVEEPKTEEEDEWAMPSWSTRKKASHKSVIEPTNAKFDSGYGSMPDAVSESNEQDDDNRSIRSILTNASRVLLPPQQEEHLISAFVGDLCQDIGFCGDLGDARDRISARLPDLLKTFTMRLEGSVNSKTERDAKEFVRQQRDRITYQLRESQMPVEMSEDVDQSTPPEDGISLAEKMALWNTAEHPDLPPEPAPVDQQLDEAQVPPRYQEVRSFLLDGLAYQWLLENARSSALLTERKGTILEAVTRMIDAVLSSMKTPKSLRSQVFQVNFKMDWDLPNFLRGQGYDTTLEIAVEHAITVTGSSSNAQALSCMDYMCQTWPSSGREVVRVLQKALISPNLTFSSCLTDGTELNINLRLPKALIVARGNQAALTELCEQLAWLGAALRTSPASFGICLTTPRITAFKDARSSSLVPSIMVHLGFTITPSLDHGLSTDVNGTCWHAMFRNPVVVNSFPILARHENEQGLELPLNMMSILAEAHFATRYDTTLVLKGLCTMLVPTRQTERSITWHFLFNEDGKRIPYYSFRERCPGWIGTDEVSTGRLEAGNFRNFVGWASDITRHLGTEEVEYSKIDWAGARKRSAGLAVEQKLTISVSKIVGGSVSVVRGNRDKPEYVKQSIYSMQIENARNIYVVLYDVVARRGWLVDGASALLHLVRTQVVREPYGGADSLFNNLSFNRSTFNHPRIDGGPNAAADILKDNRNMKHVILREFDSYACETINVPRPETVSTVSEDSSNKANNLSGNETPNSSEGRKEIYMTTCLRELVSQTWSTLEQIYDRQIEVATTHTMKQLQNPFGTTLEGYEFMGIVSARHILTRRAVSLQSNGAAWIGLARRIHAITLFGQHFGDIYKPAESIGRQICENWRTVPRGHEYLAAPISLLKRIKQYSREEGEVDAGSPEIAEGLLWSQSKDAFNTCLPGCKHVFPNRVQQLRSSIPGEILGKIGWGENGPRKADAFAEINGAVLFGEGSVLDVEKLELSSPLAVHTEGSFYDSGVGLSLQASSQTNPATASSSGVNPDSQPARLSADSTRTSLSPLDQTGAKSMSGDHAGARDTICGTENPPTSCASTEAGLVWVRQTDDDAVARANSLSQQAMSPGPAVTNMSTEDVPALDQALGRRGKFTAGLREKLAKTMLSRWKRGDMR